MKPLVVANWKMHKNSIQAKEYGKALNAKLAAKPLSATLVLCPPYLFIPLLFSESARYVLGAQNCHFEQEGAFTGEVSPQMLIDQGCRYVILGHSERRKMGEEDSLIAKKIKTAVKVGLTPILCVGETWEEQEKKQSLEIVRKQLAAVSEMISPQNVVIAYEPVWAIGTGKTPTVERISQMHQYIKKETSAAMQVLYGGSVDRRNVKEISAAEGVEGLLVGGASLDPHQFYEIASVLEFLR